MPRLTVNLSEAQERGPIEDGTHPCRVLSVSDPKQGDKSKYVTWVFQVREGELEGRQIWHNTPVTGKGAGMFADIWAALTGEELAFGEDVDLDVDTDDVIGVDCGVVTKQREYPVGSGDYVTDVKKVLPER